MLGHHSVAEAPVSALARSGLSVSIGLASEADTAFALTAARARGIGVAAETDSAQSVTVAKALAVALALETDTALSFRGAGLSPTSDLLKGAWRLYADLEASYQTISPPLRGSDYPLTSLEGGRSTTTALRGSN